MDFEMSPCHICGLSVRGTPCFIDDNDPPLPEDEPLPEYFNELDWFAEARLLCDPDDEFGQILPGLEDEYLDVDDLRSKIQADSHGVRPRCQASDIEVYPAEPEDKHQYTRWELDGSYKWGETSNKVVCFSHRYWAFDNRAYASSTQPWPTLTQVLQTLGSSPLEIDGLTECLLKNLQQCRSKVHFASDHAARLMADLAAMPTEVLDQTCTLMGSDLPRVSSRVLAQKIWKNTLKAGRRGLLPWLWDIDPTLIDAKDAESCPGGSDFEWDWELLVRQLSRGVDYGLRLDRPKRGELLVHQMATTGYHSDLFHVPPGLHNRRRIWQLVEEMFVGDTLPYPGRASRDGSQPPQKECFPLCWSKSGDILPSPVWLPSIEMGGYLRKIGGGIYEYEGQRSPQYWQLGTDSDEKNHEEEDKQEHNKEAENKDGGEDGQALPASLEEIYSKLRPLGYPV
ncbi:hypothetical protein GQ607_008806 [Colletotrichum asianum]|uniref:Uncharacterized protein n=1 Tax=Colletotrichum asianum TaxID=702518 RepID=A0A8H3WBM5_9PEZI|nr:hypothetical protein GQ607_008806 [Colletotrichum asianum]